ncbi:MAG: sigma-70 family RNA polymerase sigma factor [Clostridiales bacterium]|nr:sigma-70 family RNA polymerase sigma factor [Clostridiales bacterium]
MALISLSDGELDFLAVKAKSGDDVAMAALITAITPVAKVKADRFSDFSKRISGEDLFQEGMIGFIEAVRHFDPSRQTHFRSYLDICLENRMKKALMANSNSKNAVLTEAVSIEDGTVGLTGGSVDVIADRENCAAIVQAVNSVFSKLEKDVFYLRIEGFSYSEIALKLSVSTKTVDNAVQRIRKKVRAVI